jgi:hypothetical protein
MAWLQLAQKERIGAEYGWCSVCGTYFVAGGNEGRPDLRSRQYCSDRCHLAAKATRS